MPSLNSRSTLFNYSFLLVLARLPGKVLRERDDRNVAFIKGSPLMLGRIKPWLTKGFCTRRYLFAATVVLGLASALSLWASAGVTWPGSQLTSRARVAGQPFVPNVLHNQAAASPAPSSITVETLTLTPRGFEPNEINRSAGMFILGVNNRIIGEQFSFELLRENGHRVHQFKMTKGQMRLRKQLNLPSGRYSLKAVDHPEWTCSIVLSR